MKVFDTDTLTLLLKRHDRVVDRWSRETEPPVISVITRIEVFQGRFSTLLKATDGNDLKRGQERLAQAERDLMPFAVLLINEATAHEFDRLRLNRKLKKIGRGDLLIAAIALAYSVTLVTRNLRDFQQVSGLKLENWAD